ncbi:MAG: extracellular solute-binding protein [candidate division Zixibacteria bacterium]|nr:extracellular solute-binding protein [candidate division Zixibacteria bacterium]
MKRYLLFIVLIALAITSCGTSNDNKITITWWHFWTDTSIKPIIEEITADFEKKHPGVKVELVDLTWADGHDKIAISFSSGAGPDVVELGSDWIPEFSSTGHLLDISDKTESYRDGFLIWEPGLYENRHYAFPWILGTRVLFINQNLLMRAKYAPDYFPGYWNDLLTACERINSLGEEFYGFGSNSAERHRLYKKFLPFLWSNGGTILSNDGKSCVLDNPENVAALEYYLKLCKTGLTDTQRRLEDAFLDGKIGFVISGDWLLKRIAREKPDFAFNTALIPTPDTNSVISSFAGGEYLCVNSKSAHPDLAFELVKHICSPENQLKFCQQNKTPTPSSVTASTNDDFISQPHFMTFINQLKQSKMPPAHPKWVYIEAELERAIEEALYEVKTPADALKDAITKIDEILSQ